MRTTKWTALLGAVAILAILIAACGGAAPTPQTTPEGANASDSDGMAADEVMNDESSDMKDESGDRMDDESDDMVDDTPGDMMGDESGDMVDNDSGDMMDDQSGDMVDNDSGDMMGDESGDMTDEPGDMVDDESNMMDDQSSDMVDDESNMMGDESGDMMEAESGDMPADESGDMMEDESGDMPADESGAMMDDSSGDIETADEAMAELPAWFSAELTDVNSGQLFSIADAQGEVVLLETMAIWCSNCLRQQRQVQALHEALGDREDWITVVLDIDPNEDAAKLQEYAAQHGFNWTYAVAPAEVSREISQLYGAQFLNPPSTPMLIIDRHGQAHPLPFGIKSAAELEAALAPFLSEGM